jgi:hypothetical protein
LNFGVSLKLEIDAARSFIQNNNGTTAQNSSSQSNKLPLTLREVSPTNIVRPLPRVRSATIGVDHGTLSIIDYHAAGGAASPFQGVSLLGRWTDFTNRRDRFDRFSCLKVETPWNDQSFQQRSLIVSNPFNLKRQKMAGKRLARHRSQMDH